ncbi:DUF2868 domain-containing protein [Zwartia vadi]|uniref:DUF2868 domain-containing protein n=1 Tax=Zwartia vadi TaxID=3058168 RepID=UPI0025B45D87|nr:DUF2868 domain-containing protein [Zwartia vadi]MDN3987596.1 DUF2868 domain-containing protein [Zwartia vadi]
MKKTEPITFQQAWLCEAMRLRESQWGPRDDSKARRLAQNELTPLAKVVRRALELSQSSGLTTTITKLFHAGWGAFLLMLILASIAGGSLALAALGNALRPVNIVWALLTLLGLNIFTLLIWCLALFSPKASGGRFAQLWPWLTRKLARGPDLGLAVQAWWSVWRQAHASRWILSLGTHFLWMTILLSAAVVMLFTLSTRQYDFVWETTVLPSSFFVQLIGWLSVIPSWFGFAVPDSESIRISGTLSTDNTEALRLLWSQWLLGCLTIYGILPRAFLFMLSLIVVLKRSRRINPDLTSPYYQAVLKRISPSDFLPEGSHPDNKENLTEPETVSNPVWETKNVLIAIELDPKETWPPNGIGHAVTCAEPVDSRASRQQVLINMMHVRPRNIVLACDARHSPDRGTLRLIRDLSELSKRTLLWLRYTQASGAHTEAWLAQLRGMPEIELKLHDDVVNVMQWLERHHD